MTVLVKWQKINPLLRKVISTGARSFKLERVGDNKGLTPTPLVNVSGQIVEMAYSPVNLTTKAREFIICKLRSASMIKISVKIPGQDVSAILDPAAEVSILSDQFFKKLHIKPKIVKKVIMHAAGLVETCRWQEPSSILLG